MTCISLEFREMPPPGFCIGRGQKRVLPQQVYLPLSSHLKGDSLEAEPDTYRLSSSQRWGPCRRIWNARSPPHLAAVLRCCSHTWGWQWQIRWCNVRHPALSPGERGNLQTRTQEAVSPQTPKAAHHTICTRATTQGHLLGPHPGPAPTDLPAPLAKSSRVTNPG